MNKQEVEAETGLTLDWDKSTETCIEAAIFAARIIGMHAPYISHGEIQTGLSDDGQSWVPDLEVKYLEDFAGLGEDRDLLVARQQSGEIAGIAIVAWEASERRQFAVIEDMAVDPDLRSSGIGAHLLAAVDERVKARGIEWLFLESGKENVRAHGFFERHGFHEISHVFGKRV